MTHAFLEQATRTLPANADAHLRVFFTCTDATCFPSAIMQDRQYSARVPAISLPVARFVRNQCATMHRECLKMLPEWQHCSLIAKSAGVQSSAAAPNIAILLLYIKCDAHQSRCYSNVFATYSPVLFSPASAPGAISRLFEVIRCPTYRLLASSHKLSSRQVIISNRSYWCLFSGHRLRKPSGTPGFCCPTVLQ